MRRKFTVAAYADRWAGLSDWQIFGRTVWDVLTAIGTCLVIFFILMLSVHGYARDYGWFAIVGIGIIPGLFAVGFVLYDLSLVFHLAVSNLKMIRSEGLFARPFLQMCLFLRNFEALCYILMTFILWFTTCGEIAALKQVAHSS